MRNQYLNLFVISALVLISISTVNNGIVASEKDKSPSKDKSLNEKNSSILLPSENKLVPPGPPYDV